MVRVVGLKKQVDAGVVELPADGAASGAGPGRNPQGCRFQLMNQICELFRDELLPLLKKPAFMCWTTCAHREAERERRQLLR